MTVTADDLDAAVSAVVAALRPAADRDWSAQAGTLEWDCWHTAEHIGDCLLSYAGQLAVRPAARYVRFLASADAGASPAEVLEFAEAGGRILAATVRTAPRQARAYHPTGMADPEGFAAMGCAGTRGQPRSARRHLQRLAGAAVPRGRCRPGRCRPVGGTAVGNGPGRAAQASAATGVALARRPAGYVAAVGWFWPRCAVQISARGT